MNRPFLSIIIPVYNSSSYIERCLNSIYPQNDVEFEVICIDDESKDNSVQLIQEFQKKHNNLFLFCQKNAGPGIARNTGFTHAKGEYIWFVDSDDWIAENAKSILYKISIETKAEIVCFDFCNAKKKTEQTHISNNFQGKNISQSVAMLFEPSAPWAKIYKTDFLSKNNFSFPSYYFAEDLAETSRLFSLANSIYKIDTVLYYYFDNQQSVSKKHLVEETRQNDFLQILQIIKINSEKYLDYKNELEYLLYNHAQTYISNIKKIDSPTKEILLKKINEFLQTINIENNLYKKIETNATRYYENSLSWKITKPLREIKRILRKIKK